MQTRLFRICWLFQLALSASACRPPPPGQNDGQGHFTYTFEDQVYRVAAEEGAEAENLSETLGGGGVDRLLTQSASGDWMTLSAERFECSGECLVRMSWDLESGEAVLAGGAEVYVSGVSAITDDGNTVIYPAQDGPHEVDLFVTVRSADGWSTPTVLTTDSTYNYNNMPALSFDGDSVVFDCGTEPYPESGGNDACRVNLDGTGFAKVIGPDALPDPRNNYVQNPHEGPEGLYFESSWPIEGETPETIWMLPNGSATPVPLGGFDNAVAPCALPDGRIGMLWLGGNDDGRHELVVADADGSNVVELTPGIDVSDIGLGCGG